MLNPDIDIMRREVHSGHECCFREFQFSLLYFIDIQAYMYIRRGLILLTNVAMLQRSAFRSKGFVTRFKRITFYQNPVGTNATV